MGGGRGVALSIEIYLKVFREEQPLILTDLVAFHYQIREDTSFRFLRHVPSMGVRGFCLFVCLFSVCFSCKKERAPKRHGHTGLWSQGSLWANVT